jgi:hypothetical protein
VPRQGRERASFHTERSDADFLAAENEQAFPFFTPFLISVAALNSNPSHNSLIKKEGYAVPASGTDSIVDCFPLVGKRVSCLQSV